MYWNKPRTEAQLIEHIMKNRMEKVGDCWEWRGATNRLGYGSIRWNGKGYPAHRLSYILHNGPIPDELKVCHTCDNRLCINPAHLWLGTQADNIHDMDRKGRGRKLRGEQHCLCKLTEDQVREIRRRYAAGGISQEQLAKEYGLIQCHVGRIVRRENWAHID